ncbi:formate-dependent phosphoribosylglycinamide formyltransferase [Persicimonas caeni]|uniref:Formate-dependent phosphoribosylglycinamide formyltransferase n=1 Tax=Persicimonas caeni TaxID=2292766 RepID=A0A4Y6Q1C2_PERCE|nr:formate-dependent phosphoribosylglycinamide formyltransferase [Persicimonas caeni]QDG54378.1 formate-dependent phosphoribosylglycinamide formyltransferase [Persicimonas caeni]QED35599.1 formate-dependent phosphoribosylglycinamide formyltransferase [Persicimonas caeni]
MSTLTFGTPNQEGARKLLLLGSGELGKEVILEAQRLGVETIAVDSYEAAPAMQVAHRSHVIDMQDADALRALVEKEKPDFIVPEIEAIATATLEELEEEGFNVIPTARATRLTMDREGIRKLVAEELGLRTSPYAFASTEEEFLAAVEEIGTPCVVKPVMSSSGKGQSVIEPGGRALDAWEYAIAGSRGRSQRVIVEGFVDFDTEITLLTVRHAGGTSFCPPVGHRQEGGDYVESWQPQPLADGVLEEAQQMAAKVTEELGGWGLFGVEFFIDGETVYFSELSPRPHDTGMVTMVSQELSEFALHVRAILGLPIPEIALLSPGASAVIRADGHGTKPIFTVDTAALETPGTHLRLFGKPTTRPGRRMGVGLARAESVEQARENAKKVASAVEVGYAEDAD